MEFINDKNFFLKLELVLTKLVTPDIRISDDTVFQKLFDSVSKVFSVKECQDKLIGLFVPWINLISKNWKEVHINCKIFAWQLVSLVSGNVNGFYSLNENCSLQQILSTYRCNGNNDFSLTLAFIDIISSCMKHNPGIKWVSEKGAWKDILNIALSNRSLYALRKSRSLIAEIVYSQINNNLQASQCILDRIFSICCSLIDEIQKCCSSVMKTIENKKEMIPDNLQNLNPVTLLREIYQNLLDKRGSLEKLPMIGLENLKEWAWKCIQGSENFMVLSNISKLLCVLNVISVPETSNGKINYSDMRNLSQKVIEHCAIFIKKKEFGLVQEACVEYLVLWHRYGKEIEYDVKESTVYSFENTPFTILSVPLYMFLRLASITESDVMDAFAARVCAGSCIQTRRVCYLYREHFRMHSDTKLQTLAVSVIHCYLRIANISKKEQGVIIFQTLFHVLKKIIPNEYVEFDFKVYSSTCTEEQFPQYFGLLTATLEALHYFISHFEISWRESLETLCVTHLVQAILTMSNLPARMYTDALKVMKVILIGYLPVSLALVMDSIDGFSVHRLGGQVNKLLHNIHWEVRDSALELLQIISALAEKKMPAFQSLLLENDFPNHLTSVVEKDSEPYVRASAISCLSYIVRLQSVWNSSIENQVLLDKICHILVHEPEGIVRCKSVFLLKDLYNNQKLSQESVEKMFDLLCHVSLKDLHWEVKTAAILFWDSILEKVLTDEGMVDGEFPDHIFSREKRKIIKLTPTEMSLRILKVFERLSSYGCLHVLWEVIQHDCDIEVTKEAGKLILKMIKLMEKFGALARLKEMKSEMEDVKNICSNVTEGRCDSDEEQLSLCGIKEPTLTADEVIESIVSEGDINLLPGLLKTNNSLPKQLAMNSRIKLDVKSFFTNVLNFDVKKSEAERVEWITVTSDGIISLFDDILLSNQSIFSKTNVIDCY